MSYKNTPVLINPARAKKLLQQLSRTNARLVVLKTDNILFVSTENSIIPLLRLTELFPAGLNGATIVDMIVGGCAATIFSHLKVKEVITRIISADGATRFHQAQIPFYYENLVPEIRNRTDTGICPFEQLARKYSDPTELIVRIREQIKTGGHPPSR